jgi:anti-sigma B factor antagonist
MEIEHNLRNNILIIHFKGERLDAKDAPQCKIDLIDLITEKQKYQVVFDLNKLYFIDSSGLGVLLSVLRFLNTHGGELKLSHITKPVLTSLELVSLNKIFEIFETQEEAVNSFDPKLHTTT